MATVAARQRTYEVRTYGCQMNVHDSERLSGSLQAAGYTAADGEQADVVVINTCAVRENADNRLYGNLGQLAGIKRDHPGMQIAVGGCLAQKDKNVILEKAPWVDVVFGTHNMGSLPTLLERARHNDEAQIEILEALDVFPSTLPTKRDSTHSGWVSISVGCNNTCTFCIVPSLRGKEKDRRPGDVLAEIQALVDDGAIEVTLLGQNVNSYGVEFGDRQAFGKLLRAAGTIDGLERIRFTSPHPAAFTDDVIDAMAETPNVMPQLHMPLQSGSDRVLKAMRRSYRSERFLGILDRVRAKIPNAAISTDIIVGFPGETEEDFCRHPARRRAGSVRQRLHVPVLDPPRHPGGDDGRPAAEARRAGAVRAARRAAGTHHRGRERRAGRPERRGPRRDGRGAEGRRHPPVVRTRRGLAARALRRAGGLRGPATRRRRDGRDHPSGPALPDRRRRRSAAHPTHPCGRRLGPRRGRELRRADPGGARRRSAPGVARAADAPCRALTPPSGTAPSAAPPDAPSATRRSTAGSTPPTLI
ncbi:tRNA (N6-isopentenyl adenosine(37)-C2)-methylthiotransferase MiaB [Sphingomonas sp. LR61]|uniref:tRNA (N6-isopentenyl adenosine(37)-C2)-methylthiotransferase MiaB n=1 Tax=Sphingomonas sp. LR61 TaxID=3050234 RepID=UPI002FE37476